METCFAILGISENCPKAFENQNLDGIIATSGYHARHAQRDHMGAGHRRNGIDFMNSEKNTKVHVGALEYFSLKFETTYEEQNSMPE